METNEQKPISDLERIQRSYTTGGQVYEPAKDQRTYPVSPQEGSKIVETWSASFACVSRVIRAELGRFPD